MKLSHAGKLRERNWKRDGGHILKTIWYDRWNQIRYEIPFCFTRNVKCEFTVQDLCYMPEGHEFYNVCKVCMKYLNKELVK